MLNLHESADWVRIDQSHDEQHEGKIGNFSMHTGRPRQHQLDTREVTAWATLEYLVLRLNEVKACRT